MLRNLRRALSPQMIEYGAPRQARFMGMFADGDNAKVAKAIKNKGELYDIGLFPDKAVAQQAQSDFDAFRMGTPAMQQIGADMQRFYGFNTGQPVTRELVSEAVQQPSQALYQSTVARTGPPAQHPVSMEEGIAIAKKRSNAYPEPIGPDPRQQAANDLKDDYVNHTVGYDVQKTYDTLMTDLKNLETPKPKGFLLDDPMADTALWAGAAMLAGGGIGRATAPEQTGLADYNDPELIRKLIEAGYITSV